MVSNVGGKKNKKKYSCCSPSRESESHDNDSNQDTHTNNGSDRVQVGGSVVSPDKPVVRDVPSITAGGRGTCVARGRVAFLCVPEFV